MPIHPGKFINILIMIAIPMRVHTIVAYFYPSTGGVETRILEVSKRLMSRGWDVTVHTSANTPDKKALPFQEKVEGVMVQRYKPLFHRGFYLTYWRPKINDGDIIDIQSYHHISNSITAAKYRKKYPIFLTTHLLVDTHEQWFHSMLRSTYDLTLGKRALKYSHKIITMTDAEKDWCVKRGADPNKIIAIPSGVGDEAFDQYNPAEMKEKYGLKKYILFIGRMFREKDPMHLVTAFSKIAEKFNDVSLVFVGPDQGETGKVMALARNLKLHDSVICTGKIAEREKYELLSGCEFFAMPSRYEAQGIVFIEAWAQKKAVIGAKVGGVPYIVKDGETGLLYDHGEIDAFTKHIKYLLENPEVAKAMGRRGFEIASKEYRWKNVIDRLESLYIDAIREFGKKV